MTDTIATQLDRTGAILHRRGWRQGSYGLPLVGKVCLEGAMLEALGYSLADRIALHLDVAHAPDVKKRLKAEPAYRWLVQHLGWKAPKGNLAGFNDAPQRTQDEVMVALTEAIECARLPEVLGIDMTPTQEVIVHAHRHADGRVHITHVR